MTLKVTIMNMVKEFSIPFNDFFLHNEMLISQKSGSKKKIIEENIDLKDNKGNAKGTLVRFVLPL
ncbi:hypothetical protein TBC1_1272 [Lentimicrobium saccharophilum]|uniref:Uncharacterized protein n=1 Tax=Lentimicrobium saccharophilum TaxID=1678841 RepID=A0A0S7C5Y0_9BACT|nr:hypothetical protein [Lentimicrobium saccharophilum]GAP44271.1 hypothetical protein TBC1_1272 [Lentimicrobium saccharophilum]